PAGRGGPRAERAARTGCGTARRGALGAARAGGPAIRAPCLRRVRRLQPAGRPVLRDVRERADDLTRDCASCGATNVGPMTSCMLCGERLAGSTPAPRFCTTCGTALRPGRPFCAACGTRVR